MNLKFCALLFGRFEFKSIFKSQTAGKGSEKGRKRLQGSELNIFRPFFFLLFFSTKQKQTRVVFAGVFTVQVFIGSVRLRWLPSSSCPRRCFPSSLEPIPAVAIVSATVRWSFNSVGRHCLSFATNFPSRRRRRPFRFFFSISSLIFWLSSENYCDIESVTTCVPCVSLHHRLLGSATRIFQSNRRTSSSTVDQLIELSGHVVVV